MEKLIMRWSYWLGVTSVVVAVVSRVLNSMGLSTVLLQTKGDTISFRTFVNGRSRRPATPGFISRRTSGGEKLSEQNSKGDDCVSSATDAREQRSHQEFAQAASVRRANRKAPPTQRSAIRRCAETAKRFPSVLIGSGQVRPGYIRDDVARSIDQPDIGRLHQRVYEDNFENAFLLIAAYVLPVFRSAYFRSG